MCTELASIFASRRDDELMMIVLVCAHHEYQIHAGVGDTGMSDTGCERELGVNDQALVYKLT